MRLRLPYAKDSLGNKTIFDFYISNMVGSPIRVGYKMTRISTHILESPISRHILDWFMVI